jgi:putative tryptophan/tyrosine transport system substrate-binding protein
MKRREFITLLGGAAAAWPFAARAQQAMPVIGFLGGGSRSSAEFGVTAFTRGLREAGYIDGQNVAVEYRWSDGQYGPMSAIMAEFVQRRVAAIVTFAGTPGAQIAKAATSTIPVVFLIGTDPVGAGLVASINRPGGNVTGVNVLTVGIAAKRLEILRDLLPEFRSIAFLMNRSSSAAEPFVREMEKAADLLGMEGQAVDARTDSDLVPAFESMVRQKAGALVVSGDQFLFSQRDRIAELAARYKIPAIYYTREYVKVGGLISYGPNDADAYHLIGGMVGRILQGSNPADLPVLQPTKFEMFINLKTAKTLGITVPAQLLALADEVIE